MLLVAKQQSWMPRAPHWVYLNFLVDVMDLAIWVLGVGETRIASTFCGLYGGFFVVLFCMITFYECIGMFYF